DLRSHVYVAPSVYGMRNIKVSGKSYSVSAKIHHKIMSTGNFAVVGTSFNFSQGAESNNEQVLVFHDPELAERVDGMTRWLSQQSRRTVNDEVQRRRRRLSGGE